MAPGVSARTLVVVEHMLSKTVEVAIPKKLQIVVFAAQMPLGTFLIVWKFWDLMCWLDGGTRFNGFSPARQSRMIELEDRDLITCKPVLTGFDGHGSDTRIHPGVLCIMNLNN